MPDKPTVSFADRYANDEHFKAQVDEARRKQSVERQQRELKKALDVVRGKSPKSY